MYDEKDPNASKALVDEGWIYLDVRTPGEFEGGHPEGATNIPFALIGPGGMMPNPMFLSVVGRIHPDKSQGLVVGCASGGRSARACQMLAQSGYTKLVNVAGGFSGARDGSGNVVQKGWEDCGLPVARGDDEGSWVQVRARATS